MYLLNFLIARVSSCFGYPSFEGLQKLHKLFQIIKNLQLYILDRFTCVFCNSEKVSCIWETINCNVERIHCNSELHCSTQLTDITLVHSNTKKIH